MRSGLYSAVHGAEHLTSVELLTKLASSRSSGREARWRSAETAERALALSAHRNPRRIALSPRRTRPSCSEILTRRRRRRVSDKDQRRDVALD